MIDAAFTLQRVTDGAREKKEMIRPTGLAFIHSVHTSSSKRRAEKSRAFCTMAAKSDVAFLLTEPLYFVADFISAEANAITFQIY